MKISDSVIMLNIFIFERRKTAALFPAGIKIEHDYKGDSDSIISLTLN